MLEAIIASTIFMTVAAAALIGVSATQRASVVIQQSAIAENMVRNQIEAIFASPYQTTTALYQAVTVPTGYNVTAAQQTLDATTDLQKITVTIKQGTKTLLEVETLRRKQ